MIKRHFPNKNATEYLGQQIFKIAQMFIKLRGVLGCALAFQLYYYVIIGRMLRHKKIEPLAIKRAEALLYFIAGIVDEARSRTPYKLKKNKVFQRISKAIFFSLPAIIYKTLSHNENVAPGFASLLFCINPTYLLIFFFRSESYKRLLFLFQLFFIQGFCSNGLFKGISLKIAFFLFMLCLLLNSKLKLPKTAPIKTIKDFEFCYNNSKESVIIPLGVSNALGNTIFLPIFIFGAKIEKSGIFRYFLVLLQSFLYTLSCINPKKLAESFSKNMFVISDKMPGEKTKKYLYTQYLKMVAMNIILILVIYKYKWKGPAIEPTIISIIFNIAEKLFHSVYIVIKRSKIYESSPFRKKNLRELPGS